jgi:MFS family permease
MGGEWAVAVALVMECWPERHRPKLAGAIGAASNVGFLLIGVVAWLSPVMTGSWRWLMLVGALPAVLSLFVTLLIPESERWKAAAKTAKSSPVLEIFGPKLYKRTLLAIVLSSIPLIGTWAAFTGWVPMWVEQMKQAELTEAVLPECHLTNTPPNELAKKLKAAKDHLSTEQWVRIEWESARAKAGIQILSAVGAILACYIAPVIGGIWGRRPVYFGLCLMSLGSCACLFRLMRPFDASFGLMAFLVGGVTAAFYGWLPLYLPELFPTRVRATGQGLGYNFGRISAAGAAVLMGVLVEMLGGNYAAAGATISSLVYLLGMVFIWLAPETRGNPLPE